MLSIQNNMIEDYNSSIVSACVHRYNSVLANAPKLSTSGKYPPVIRPP